ncbi:MAG: hypothetical protein JEY96_16790 [Bacteroidales bacterium]|nr:hypothetical protein [Bacteroidales bacterium]
MPQLYNNIVCLTHEELVPNFLSVYDYRNGTNRKKFKVARRGCYGTPALVEFESLPTRIKEHFIEVNGDPSDLAKNYMLKSLILPDAKAAHFFSNYKLPDGRFLPFENQKEYTANASLLNAIAKLAGNRKAMIKALGGSNRGLWQQLTKEVAKLKLDFEHTLPEADRRLRQKLTDYQKDGYESLISGKFLNKNSQKVDDSQKEAVLRSLLSNYRNLDNVQIAKMYNTVAETMQWKRITSSSVNNYREKWSMQIFGGLKGEVAFDNKVSMQHKRKAPSYPLQFWTVDGWDVELLYQLTSVNKEGKTVTTYHNRPTAVFVLDPCCKYPIGYAIGTHETKELIKQAIRNAVKHTGELFGNMYTPLQLQTDNYGRGTLTPFYEAATQKYTPAKVKNAKSKVIEPWFRFFNKKYCQLAPNWSGHGVKSKQQPNQEYLNKIRHSFPTYDEVAHQLEVMIALERNELREQYLKLFNEAPVGDKINILPHDFLYKLGETTGNTNRLEPSGLRPTIEKVKREYDSFDPKFRELSSIDWQVRYDPDNLSEILAVSSDGSQQFILEEKYTQPMALRERTEIDNFELKKINGYNKGLKESIIQKNTTDLKAIDTLFTENPELNNTLAKMILVDSNGQHKNRRNDNRLASAGEKVLKKQTQNDQLEEIKELKQMQEEYLKNKVNIDNYL